MIWVTETEPEWTDRERAWMLALTYYRAGRCRCGEQLETSTDPRYDGNNPQRQGRYVVGPPLICHACAALERAKDAYGKEAPSHMAHAAIHIPELQMGR